MAEIYAHNLLFMAPVKVVVLQKKNPAVISFRWESVSLVSNVALVSENWKYKDGRRVAGLTHRTAYP